MKKDTNQIILEVTLDQDKVPSKIHWRADDGPAAGSLQEVKAFLLSLYDGAHGDTLKIDLWTKDMQVNEMDRMVYFTLKSLADTYLKATNNKEVATDIRRFSDYFAEKTQLKSQE